MNIDEAEHDPYKSIGVVTLKIEKFSEFAREGKDAHRLSDPVYVRGLPWKILVMPRQIGRRDNFGNVNPKKSLGYFLQCNAKNHESTWSCPASVKLKLLAQKEGKKDHIRKIGHVFHAVETDWGFAEYMKFEELMDPENGWYDKSADSITLSAEINAQIPDGLKMQSICEDMGNLFDKEDKYSDCILVSSDGTKFKAHKCILANRSLVFAAMFEHGMVEAQNGIVNIDDIQSNILIEMIRFVYNGIHPNMGEKENIAEDLLVAAEKYGLVDLKMISERNLVFFMDNENACRLLVVASQHSAEFLKANAIKYIAENANEIMQTEDWKTLLNGNYGELVGQIFKAVIPK